MAAESNRLWVEMPVADSKGQFVTLSTLPGANSLSMLELSQNDIVPSSPAPGSYYAEPYSMIVIVPKRMDAAMIIHMDTAAYPMLKAQYPIRLVPR